MEELFKTWLVETYIAHRGLHDKNAPENSIAAFKKAMNEGYAVELDVHMISDGTLVVFHDDTLSRVTGQDGYVKNLKKDDLKNIKLAGTKEALPTFDEVLKTINGQVPILIEIKNTGKIGELESKLYETLKNYNGEYAIESFNPYSVGWFKNNAPEVIRGQLAGFLKNEKMNFIKKFGVKHMSLNNSVSQPHFIAYEAKALPNRFVKKFKHLPLIAWTVKSQKEYLEVVKYCDNIIFEGFEPKI